MAYAALVSLAQTIDQIPNRFRKDKIAPIDRYVILLQAFLEEFPEKASNLEARIRDVANEAEDIIEGNDPYYHFENKVKKVTDKIDSIAVEVMNIKKSFTIKDVRPNEFSAASSSHTGKNDMVIGFDDDLVAIKTRLCGESSKLQVIPIVGMGGIGKTTLARNSYDDPLTMQYFDIRAWVTISQDYSLVAILSRILVSMRESSNVERSGQSNESMAEKVYKSLKGRRYLIVMDDMWSREAWDDLKMIFPDDCNGSRIMLTTRLADVAAYADSSCSSLYEMRFMDPDRSWNLLRHKVFAHQYCPPELEDIGKVIARSCRGLPLAIVVIAGLLSTVSKTRVSWGEIAKNVNSAIAAKDGQFEKILSLSYIHLPHHLRPCFLYMGGFPEDYEIHVSKLIKLWLAEGFLKPNASKSFEEGAQEYLEDLVKRSLILVTNRKSNGKIKSCSVHDLVRDLCIRQAQEEKFLTHFNGRCGSKISKRSIKNQRRLSIAHSDLTCLTNIYGSTIRTIICFVNRGSSLGCLGNFRLLRVLDVVNANFSLFCFHDSFVSPPDALFELIHLRYLAFYYDSDIPSAISKLRNLQTLIIHPVEASRSFGPARVYFTFLDLPQLRHLVSSASHALHIPEDATLGLKNLETLSVVINLRCTQRTLRTFRLKKLGIICYDDDCNLENLVYLHQLEKLNLTISGSFRFRQKLNPAFPKTLKKLSLSGWGLVWKDMTIIGSLPNLQVLKLRKYACRGDEWETNEGEFLELKFLLIEGSHFQHWITERSHFPSLKCLLLHRCPNLTEIPDGIGEIPTLELIEIKRGSKSLVDSAKRIQDEQLSLGNDALQVRCPQY